MDEWKMSFLKVHKLQCEFRITITVLYLVFV